MRISKITCFQNNRNLNYNDNAKSKIVNLLMEKTGQSLKYTTSPKVFHNKFDVFRWKPKGDKD